MNRSSLIIACAVGAVVVVAAVLFRKEEQSTVEAPTPGAVAPQAAHEGGAPIPEKALATSGSTASYVAPKLTAPAPEKDLGDPTEFRFKVDGQGRIVTDERARVNLENLNARFTPAERKAKIEELQATLPPAAARQLAEMMERYVNYDTAQQQTFPPSVDLTSPEEGLNTLDGMHSLRVQYFGADAASSMFGKEEQTQRELLRLMSLETDEKLTIQEKARRAQAQYMEAQQKQSVSPKTN